MVLDYFFGRLDQVNEILRFLKNTIKKTNKANIGEIKLRVERRLQIFLELCFDERADSLEIQIFKNLEKPHRVGLPLLVIFNKYRIFEVRLEKDEHSQQSMSVHVILGRKFPFFQFVAQGDQNRNRRSTVRNDIEETVDQLIVCQHVFTMIQFLLNPCVKFLIEIIL